MEENTISLFIKKKKKPNTLEHSREHEHRTHIPLTMIIMMS